MRLHVRRDVLREQILNCPDIPTEAGFPIEAFDDVEFLLSVEPQADDPSTEEGNPQLRAAFSIMLKLLREHKDLNIEELAAKTRTEVQELADLEAGIALHPKPRTIHQLAEFYGLPERSFRKVSGVTRSRSARLTEDAEKFAANADHVDDRLESVIVEFLKTIDESTEW